jgi:hypothetical protein
MKEYVDFTIRKIEYATWVKFKRFLCDAIDDETGKAVSANKKIKEFIEGYVRVCSADELSRNKRVELDQVACEEKHSGA